MPRRIAGLFLLGVGLCGATLVAGCGGDGPAAGSATTGAANANEEPSELSQPASRWLLMDPTARVALLRKGLALCDAYTKEFVRVHGGSVSPAVVESRVEVENMLADSGRTIETTPTPILPPTTTDPTDPDTDHGGKPDGEEDYNFNGRIDEVRIYNRALSASEIQSDMNTALQ